MKLCYAACSAPSAQLIADEDDDIYTVRSSRGDVNWGKATAHTALNPDIRNTTNKRRMRELFKEHGVPMPSLVEPTLAFGPWSENTPIVGRPDTHTKGRGFWLCRNMADVYKAQAGTRKKKPATHFMEFIDAPREYRVHIFKGKSIRISEKSFFLDEDGKRDYTTAKPQHAIKHVRRAAKKALKAVGLDFGAVDILARGDDNAEVFVLEVNAAPGLGGSMPKVYADMFRRWYEGDFDG